MPKLGFRRAKKQKNRLKEIPLFVLGLICTPKKAQLTVSGTANAAYRLRKLSVIDAERSRSASTPAKCGIHRTEERQKVARASDLSPMVAPEGK